MNLLKTFALPPRGNIAHIAYNKAEDVYMVVLNGLNGSLRVLSNDLDDILFDTVTYHNGHANCAVFHQAKQEVCDPR
jgi:hypothetical protein